MGLEHELINLVRGGAHVRTHSGQVRPGDIFVALPGSRVHGGQFCDDAVARGARAVVYGRDVLPAQHSGVLYVQHSRPGQVLGVLARIAEGTEHVLPRIIGVTGTNGKTTVAYLVEHLLRAHGRQTGLIGTISATWNGHSTPSAMTTPDCLTLHGLLGQMQREQVSDVVMEISSHALDQERIAAVPVAVGIFTNLTQDHLDYHQNMDAYFAAKARLFLDPESHCVQGTVNVDDSYGRELLARRSDLLSYGLDNDADLQGTIVEAGPWGMCLRMTWHKQSWDLRTALVGRHNAANLLAAQGAGLLLGLVPEQMSALATALGAPGRLERVPNTQGLTIFVDYAHTPDALEKVLTALKDMGFARLITVFGCGGDRDVTKRPRMGQAVARFSDVAVLTSDNPRTEDPEAILDQVEPGLRGTPIVYREVDRRKAIALAISCLRPGDALLIAGKGHEDYQIIGTEKIHFSDVDVARELVA